MNADDARRRLMEAEAQASQALGFARALITQLEDENRELRQEVVRSNVEIFTEAEFAQRCKVSPQTIARARKKGRLQPLLIGGVIRYSSVDHLAKVGEIFGARLREVKNRRTGT
jgi:hypothetical protein